MPERPEKEITRRGFMTKFGQGLVVANVAGRLLKEPWRSNRWRSPIRRARNWAGPCLAWAI
jgi:hypothetical protein